MLGIDKNWLYTSLLFFFLLILLYLGGLASTELLVPFLFFTIVVIIIISFLYMKGQTFSVNNLSTRQKIDLINDDLKQLHGGDANCFIWDETLIYEKTICDTKHKPHDFFAIKGIPTFAFDGKHRTKQIAIYNLTKGRMVLYEPNPLEIQRFNPFYNFDPFPEDKPRFNPDRFKSGSDVHVYQGSPKQHEGALNNE